MGNRRPLHILGFTLLIFALVAGGVLAEAKLQLVIKPEPEELTVEVWTDRGKHDADYYVGEPVRLYVRTSDDAYVTLYCVMPNGRAELIFPNAYDRDNYLQAGETLIVPGGDYRLQVVGPSGREIVRAIATEYPITFPRDWFSQDRDTLQRQIETRLSQSETRWATDWASINVRQGRRATATIKVHSYQEGVRLYVDGQYHGTLPETVELTPGPHELVAMKEGHRVKVRQFHVFGQEQKSWSVRLEPLGKPN
ncbi:MAG: DUF4384 domain-containing protein [Firmicutes bacterium]|nr:DUF4384 domain-containing protein [Bacillota bacterium]